MKYREPITDRAASDLVARTDKAFFNVTDWERIYGNAEYVNGLIDLLMGINITFDTISAPVMTSIPTVDDFNTLLTNINRLRVGAGFDGVSELSALKADWAAGASATSPTYLDVNAWEDMLKIILRLVGTLVDWLVFCGVSAVGQPRFYQHRFRNYPFVQNAVSPTRKPRTNVAICGNGLMRGNGFRRYG